MVINESPEKQSINSRIEEIENEFIINRSMAFNYLCLESILDLNIDDIDKEIVIIDWNQEEWIDLIYFEKNNKNEYILNIFTCKSSLTNWYSSVDLEKLRWWLRYLFEEKKDNYEKIPNIPLVQNINNIRENKTNIIEINIFYCCFYWDNDRTSEDVIRKKEEIELYYKKFLAWSYSQLWDCFKIKLINYKNIYEYMINNWEPLKKEEIEINYYDKEKKERPVREINWVKWYVTILWWVQLANIVEKYWDKIFEKNIRWYLNLNKNTKNPDIYDTCSWNNSNFFWFLNNWITIIWDKVYADDDSWKWKITNLQIVNWQQTVRTFHKAFKDSKLKTDTYVLCRIFELQDKSFVNQVTKTTNSQNSIWLADLVSNDLLQKSIAENFSKKGIFYKRQKWEKKFNWASKTITSKNLARILLSIYIKKPSIARLWKEDELFNINKSYNNIFKRSFWEIEEAFDLFEKTNEKIKNLWDWDLYAKYWIYHIVRIIKELGIFTNENFDKALLILKEIINKNYPNIEETELSSFFSKQELDTDIFKYFDK